MRYHRHFHRLPITQHPPESVPPGPGSQTYLIDGNRDGKLGFCDRSGNPPEYISQLTADTPVVLNILDRLIRDSSAVRHAVFPCDADDGVVVSICGHDTLPPSFADKGHIITNDITADQLDKVAKYIHQCSATDRLDVFLSYSDHDRAEWRIVAVH